MADEKAKKNDDEPDAKSAESADARRDRFTWHPDDIRVVRRNGVDIPPTKLSDLLAREKAEEEAKTLPDNDKLTETGNGELINETGLRRGHALLGAICLLLAGILLTNVWSMYHDIQEEQKRAYYREQASAIRELAELQDDLIFDLMDEYQSSAYGSSVDRITEQQLIAAETQIVGLQTLALQNRQIIELLLLAYEEPPVDTEDE